MLTNIQTYATDINSNSLSKQSIRTTKEKPSVKTFMSPELKEKIEADARRNGMTISDFTLKLIIKAYDMSIDDFVRRS